MATNLRRRTSSYVGVVAGILPNVTIERRHFGRKCSETVTADSVKLRRFIPMVGEQQVDDIFCTALLVE